MDIANGIQEISKMAREGEIPVIKEHGLTFTTKALVPIMEPEKSLPGTIRFNTLAGIVDFAKTEAKQSDDYKMIVVDSYKQVSLVGETRPDNFQKRATHAIAENDLTPFRFGNFLSLEEFVINLMSTFVNEPIVADILNTLGNLATEAVATNKDDGFSQKLSISTGITTKAKKPVENPVTLRPFRTFPEIEQPESICIIRYKTIGNEGLFAGLWEADGGKWKTKAVSTIVEWLSNNVDIPVIG